MDWTGLGLRLDCTGTGTGHGLRLDRTGAGLGLDMDWDWTGLYWDRDWTWTETGPDWTHLEEADKMRLEVIVDSSPCSATCGLGVKTQTLCLLKDGQTAMEEDVNRKDGAQVSEECRVRKVRCQKSWQCGLRTMTVTSGERVEIDCVGDVMEAVGRFSWRVSWRLARGIISSDDFLFTRWDAPLLDRVVLEAVREEDAGTYRCDVQDASFRRVKRVYWGIRVLPVGVLNLNKNSPGQLKAAGNQNNTTMADLDYSANDVIRWFYAMAFVGLIVFCYQIVKHEVDTKEEVVTAEAQRMDV
ncbi:transmembrane protein 81 [Tautogolabrus adspersus]